MLVGVRLTTYDREYLPPLLTLRSTFIASRNYFLVTKTVVTLKSALTSTYTIYDLL